MLPGAAVTLTTRTPCPVTAGDSAVQGPQQAATQNNTSAALSITNQRNAARLCPGSLDATQLTYSSYYRPDFIQMAASVKKSKALRGWSSVDSEQLTDSTAYY